MMRDWMGHGATRIAAILACALVMCAAGFAVFYFLPVGVMNYSTESDVTAPSPEASSTVPLAVSHIPTPDPLKAVYMTACTASRGDLRDKVLSLFNKGSVLNALVIDVKDYTGTISYASTSLQPRSAGNGCHIPDLPAFLTMLHSRGIYTIGRITVFQDPWYASTHTDLAIRRKSDPQAIWKDKNGLGYIDVGASPYWDYIISIAEEAHSIGFDELNFDYIRFPSDGNLEDMLLSWDASTTKAEADTNFFTYLHEHLVADGITSSADLFGLTTSATGDMGIGQVLENALPNFDYISPMVYPSHFAPGFDGFSKPAEHPYEVIQSSMSRAVERAVAASTTPAMVRSQMQATYDSGLDSWMLWNAASQYQTPDLAPSGPAIPVSASSTALNEPATSTPM